MYYYEILKDFNFSMEKDIESAKILNSMIKRDEELLKEVESIIKDRVVHVYGAGPSLLRHIEYYKHPLVVADGACKAFLENDIIPDIIVSDLDGDLNALKECNKKGSIVVVHAHGDNIERIKSEVPKLKDVIGTHQVPDLKLENLIYVGGFTDGDRACYFSKYFGAKKLILGGMDFGEFITKYSRPNLKRDVERGDEIKIKKLRWAKRLIELLSREIEIEFLR
ncbi:6-hydroxymethylpterin diphosphokinase MptE-like protein [Methanocaldococcus infernus]